MKYAVIGSRSFNNYDQLKNELDRHQICEIISGGAKGADQLAEYYAQENCIPIEIIKPDWKRYGTAAGIIRNKEIIDKCEAVIVFWDGESKGTRSSINFAEDAGKKITVHLIS